MKKTALSILVSLVVIGAISPGHAIAQDAPICRTQAVVSPGGPDMCVSVVLKDTAGNLKDSFLLGEDIMVVISMENVGSEDIITSDGFSAQDFHLLLTLPRLPTGMPDPPPPPVRLINGQLVQVEKVEVLPVGWDWTVDPFNAYDFYSLTQGSYTVKAVIPMRTYPPVSYTHLRAHET